jgi:hypothetical protein
MFMFHLGRLIAEEPRLFIEFDAEGNRIRYHFDSDYFSFINRFGSCFSRVINIATQTILAELTENPWLPVVSSVSQLPYPELVAYVDALESDPVGGSRRIVASCRASGQRLSSLKIVIKQGNEKQVWPPNGVLRVIQLLRDCETRWSSTFMMNDRVIELYPVSLIPVL